MLWCLKGGGWLQTIYQMEMMATVSVANNDKPLLSDRKTALGETYSDMDEVNVIPEDPDDITHFEVSSCFCRGHCSNHPSPLRGRHF